MWHLYRHRFSESGKGVVDDERWKCTVLNSNKLIRVILWFILLKKNRVWVESGFGLGFENHFSSEWLLRHPQQCCVYYKVVSLIFCFFFSLSTDKCKVLCVWKCGYCESLGDDMIFLVFYFISCQYQWRNTNNRAIYFMQEREREGVCVQKNKVLEEDKIKERLFVACFCKSNQHWGKKL